MMPAATRWLDNGKPLIVFRNSSPYLIPCHRQYPLGAHHNMLTVFSLLLILATLGCALVAGLTLVFAIVIMPGLKTLGDLGFLQGFKAIDRVIQDGQPLFMLVWIGSALALILATLLGFWLLRGVDLVLLITALIIYIAGVQIATVKVNIPLNNRLQALDLAELDAAALAAARADFEPRWLRWNLIRTWLATLTSVLLLVLLLRI
jgi:uncharacterized membrane protein